MKAIVKIAEAPESLAWQDWPDPAAGFGQVVVEIERAGICSTDVAIYNWTYKGEQVMLVPGFLRADALTFSGKNNWYPNVPWELRRVIALEATPKGQHPYSKRVFYLDAQTYTLFSVLSYGPQGELVRLSLIVHGNPDFVHG